MRADERPHDVVLKHVDRKRNMWRHYAIRVLAEPLFARWALRFEWGRLSADGRPPMRPKKLEESFPDERAMAARFAEVLREKRAHGYVDARSRRR